MVGIHVGLLPLQNDAQKGMRANREAIWRTNAPDKFKKYVSSLEVAFPGIAINKGLTGFEIPSSTLALPSFDWNLPPFDADADASGEEQEGVEGIVGQGALGPRRRYIRACHLLSGSRNRFWKAPYAPKPPPPTPPSTSRGTTQLPGKSG
jgi:hypothetical protein